MYVCMYVCMYIYIYIHTRVCVCVLYRCKCLQVSTPDAGDWIRPGVSRTGGPRACHGPSHLSLVRPRTFRVGQVTDRSLDGGAIGRMGISWDATAEASCSSCVFPCGRTGRGMSWNVMECHG